MYDKHGTLLSGYEIEPRAQPWPHLDKTLFPGYQIQQPGALCDRMNYVLYSFSKNESLWMSHEMLFIEFTQNVNHHQRRYQNEKQIKWKIKSDIQFWFLK